jgi:hypothetical protein
MDGSIETSLLHACMCTYAKEIRVVTIRSRPYFPQHRRPAGIHPVHADQWLMINLASIMDRCIDHQRRHVPCVVLMPIFVDDVGKPAVRPPLSSLIALLPLNLFSIINPLTVEPSPKLFSTEDRRWLLSPGQVTRIWGGYIDSLALFVEFPNHGESFSYPYLPNSHTMDVKVITFLPFIASTKLNSYNDRIL